jgi:hypothetical protein
MYIWVVHSTHPMGIGSVEPQLMCILNVAPSDPIMRLCLQIEAVRGIPVKQQRLFFAGQEMRVDVLREQFPALIAAARQQRPEDWPVAREEEFMQMLQVRPPMTLSDYGIENDATLHFVLRCAEC